MLDFLKPFSVSDEGKFTHSTYDGLKKWNISYDSLQMFYQKYDLYMNQIDPIIEWGDPNQFLFFVHANIPCLPNEVLDMFKEEPFYFLKDNKCFIHWSHHIASVDKAIEWCQTMFSENMENIVDTDIYKPPRRTLYGLTLNQMERGCILLHPSNVINKIKTEEEIQEEIQEEIIPSVSMNEEPAELPDAWVLDMFKKEQHGDAQIFSKLHENRVVFSGKIWYYWNGNVWQKDQYTMQGIIPEQLPKIYGRLASGIFHESNLLISYQTRMTKLRCDAHIRAVLRLSRTFLNDASFVSKLNQTVGLLSVKNGVLDLLNKKFRKGKPTDFFDTCAPVIWKGLYQQAPCWEKYIYEIMNGNKDMIHFLQRVLGSALLGDNRFQIFVILYGETTSNGKSILMKILKHVLGDSFFRAMSSDVALRTKFGRSEGSHTSHLVDIKGARMTFLSETERNAELAEATIKQFTGGDDIVCREIYSSTMHYRPGFVPFLLTNFEPSLDLHDEAMWRRIILIPFTQKFVDNPKQPNERKIDRGLEDKLKTEDSGILAWLVRGCHAVLKDESLSMPALAQKALNTYKKERDVLCLWIKEHVSICNDSRILSSDIYRSYNTWCYNNHLTPSETNSIAFGKALHSYKLPYSRTNKGIVYHISIS